MLQEIENQIAMSQNKCTRLGEKNKSARICKCGDDENQIIFKQFICYLVSLTVLVPLFDVLLSNVM